MSTESLDGRSLRHRASSQPRTLESLATALLCASAFSASWNGLHLGSLQIVDMTLVMAMGILALSAIAQHRLWPSTAPFWLWFAATGVLACMIIRQIVPISAAYMSGRVDLHGLHGEPSQSSMVSGIQWLVALVVLPLCVSGATCRQVSRIASIATFWLLGVAVSCVVGLLDSIGATQISASLIGDGVDYSGRQAGLCAHANSLGVSAVLAFPVATWLARRRPVTGLLLQLLLAVGTILSGSRGAQLMLVLVAGLMFVTARQSRGPMLRLVGAALVASPLAISAMGGLSTIQGTLLRFGESGGSADSSNAERHQIAVQGLHDFALHPLAGVGLDQLTYAHNIYLQILSSGGLILMLGFGSYMVFALAEGRLVRRHFPLADYLMVTIMTWLVLGMVENSLVDRFLYFPVAMIAAMGTSLAAEKSSMPPTED